jgi:hypothetical protein
MSLSVKLYRVVGKGKDRRYLPIDLGRRGRRSKEDVTGPFYLRYGVKYESVRPLSVISVGRNPVHTEAGVRITMKGN